MAIKMEWRLLVILPLIVLTAAIKVPVDNIDADEPNEPANNTSQSENPPVYYESEEDEFEEPSVDSYLIPPNPYKEEVLPDSIVTPATYLLPPSVEQQTSYYYPLTESTAQSDWYPIAQMVPKDQTVKLLPPRLHSAAIPIFMQNFNQTINRPYQQFRAGKALNVPIPSLKLEPPSEDAPNEYVINVPSVELELPAEEIDLKQSNRDPNLKFRLNVEHPTIVSHLTPPKPYIRKLKNPTKLYPKKYPGAFAPVSIPIGQYSEDTSAEIPKAKPAVYFKPSTGIEGSTLIPIDEKKVYLFEQAEKKRKFKGESDPLQEHHIPAHNYEYADDAPPTEQDASETNFRYPGQNIYRPVPVHLRQRPVPPPAPAPVKQNQVQAPPAPDDRTEFRMHGMKGPHSYQFGYDTGKGKNRQFRFEERDNDGLVHGHYGYMDKHGKMRVVNYRAHPELGFSAEPQNEPDEPQEEPKQP